MCWCRSALLAHPRQADHEAMTILVETVSGAGPAASAWPDALAAAIGARIRPLLRAGGIDPAAVTCTVENSGSPNPSVGG